MDEHYDLRVIWRQKSVPVVYHQGGKNPLLVKLPYAENNRRWLKTNHRAKPEWMAQFNCWQVPRSWFEDVVRRMLERFGKVYVIQPFNTEEKCAPACWNAKGVKCECSCMGANHGSGVPAGQWHVVSDTFAVSWEGRHLGCRLIEPA